MDIAIAVGMIVVGVLLCGAVGWLIARSSQPPVQPVEEEAAEAEDAVVLEPEHIVDEAEWKDGYTEGYSAGRQAAADGTGFDDTVADDEDEDWADGYFIGYDEGFNGHDFDDRRIIPSEDTPGIGHNGGPPLLD